MEKSWWSLQVQRFTTQLQLNAVAKEEQDTES